MVNWKYLGIAGLTYLAGWGCNDLVNTRAGYDNLGKGLRGGDKKLQYVVNETTEPLSNFSQENFHTNQIRYSPNFLEKNQYKIEQILEKGAGAAQAASIGLGLLALLNFRKRRK